MSNFTTFPIAYVDADLAVSKRLDGLGAMYFDASLLQHINCGRFWRSSVNYSHCFWEAWLKPSSLQSGAGYIVSDSQGGAHCLLWGYQPGTTGFVEITGNMHDGTTLTSFTVDEPLPVDHDVHLAIGWDGAHILGWIDGVLVYKQAYSATQRKNPGGNDATLYLMGSDHSNAYGWLYQVRGFEGYGRCAAVADFRPEMFFRPLQHPSNGSYDLPQFCMNLMDNRTMFTDHGRFEGVPHHGVLEAVQGTDYGTGGAIGTGLALPSFNALGKMQTGTYTPTAPATPSGAVIWDSFSRVNATYVNPTAGDTQNRFFLGSTEAGSAGAKTWVRRDGLADGGGAGVLNGRAFIAYQSADMVVDTGIQDMDVRVNRLPTAYSHTGLIVRCKDANDYYSIVAHDTAIVVTKVEGGVTTTASYTPTGGWKTLRVVASGTTFTTYTGTDTEGSFTSQGSFTCTNVTGAHKAGLTREIFTKEPHYADNFLVKAG